MVRPYISEIGIVTDTDKWNAVYTACERGYNYYIEGDIDDSSDTYTIIVYERTANASEAITNITAVSAEAVKALEQAQIVDGLAGQTGHVTANAVSISGSSYVRVSSQPVNAKESYYIYRTKDSKAGNPVSMLYVETPEQTQNFLFGTWANAYFFSPGVTTAYTYSMNEDLYTTLWEDQTVDRQFFGGIYHFYRNQSFRYICRRTVNGRTVNGRTVNGGIINGRTVNGGIVNCCGDCRSGQIYQSHDAYAPWRIARHRTKYHRLTQ